jgi:signal transduction histidine kinase
MRRYLHPIRLAVRRRVPRRTVRFRLTMLYGGLFFLSGAGLLLAAHLLVNGAPDVQTDNHFLAASGEVLAILTVVSITLGWFVAGRVLRPLREMTAAARRISEENLHERLAVQGPGDELKDLGDTIDGLLGRLEDAFTAQRRFVAYASHELRTPLTLARTLLETTLTDPQPTIEDFRVTCEKALAAGGMQEHLIEALLILARSQRGLDRREPVDLAVISSDVLRAYDQEAARRGLAISASICATPVQGDARLLERLVSNLLHNALRYNIPQGRVDVQVTPSGRAPSFRITNTGPIIPAAQAHELLEPFQRMPATRDASAEGLGLGLAIVAAIVKAHRATLKVIPGAHGGLDIEILFPATAAATPDHAKGRRTTRRRPSPPLPVIHRSGTNGDPSGIPQSAPTA